MRNENKNGRELLEDEEELFCQTYGVDTFEEAVAVFKEELEEAQGAVQHKEDGVFEGDDDGFDEWLKTNKGQDELLCWLWNADCGPSGPDGFCREVRDRFGEVSLKTVRFHADDLRFLLDETWG